MESRPRNQVYSVKLATADLDALRDIAEKTGILVSEQLRRAVKAWIAKQRRVK